MRVERFFRLHQLPYVVVCYIIGGIDRDHLGTSEMTSGFMPPNH